MLAFYPGVLRNALLHASLCSDDILSVSCRSALQLSVVFIVITMEEAFAIPPQDS